MEYHKTDLAYFSGLLDGEGCLRVGRFKNSNGEIRYRAQCAIAMTEKAPIEWLHSVFGGGVYLDRKRNNPKSKVCHIWQINAQQASAILIQALPYLKVKAGQARLIVEFTKGLTGQGGRGINKPIPEILLKDRERMANLSTQLNKKGRAA